MLLSIVKAPLGIISLELACFSAIVALCFLIYFKTRFISRITEHPGLFYFRGIFLYFGLAYVVRLIQVVFLFTRDYLSTDMPGPSYALSEVLLGYLGMMAIISLALTLIPRKTNFASIGRRIIIQLVAISTAVFVYYSKSQETLVFTQTMLVMFALVYAFLENRESKSKLVTQSKLIYLLLFAFWLLNAHVFTKVTVPEGYKIVVYPISVGLFLAIYLKQQRRFSHARESKQT